VLKRAELVEQSNQLSPRALLAAATAVYLSSLPHVARTEMLKKWTGQPALQQSGVDVSHFILVSTALLWHERGLSSDPFLKENLAIVTIANHLSKWPLILDPRHECSKILVPVDG